MTFVTAIPRALGVAGPLILLSLSQCTETTGKHDASSPPPTTAEIAIPAPAPLPPPPKPAIRQARPAPKSAAKATNGSEHATNEAADKSEATTSSMAEASRPGDLPAPETTTEQLALRSPGSRPPIRLIGLNRSATSALLGAPSEERQVAVARVWDYRGPDCRLAVYFYLDTGRNDFYALHYEIDGPEAGPDAEQHCLQQLRDGARGN